MGRFIGGRVIYPAIRKGMSWLHQDTNLSLRFGNIIRTQRTTVLLEFQKINLLRSEHHRSEDTSTIDHSKREQISGFPRNKS